MDNAIVARKYSVIRRTPNFKEIFIEQAYFLVKNGAPYKSINTVFVRLIYLTSKLDAEKDNPFKCNLRVLDDAYCPITQA